MCLFVELLLKMLRVKITLPNMVIMLNIINKIVKYIHLRLKTFFLKKKFADRYIQ